MITVSRFVAILGIITIASSTLSAPARAQDVLNACADDIKKYCSQVTFGNGRLLACMYAHEDKVSAKCDVAIADAADQIDWFFSRMRDAIAACATDIEKHCANVEAGEGRIFVCLKQKQAELSETCQPVVTRIAERLTDPVQ